MNKAIALAMVALLLFAAGCGGAKVGPTRAVSLAAQPANLDPALCASREEAVYVAHLFESLLMNTGASTPKYEVAAAESYQVTYEEIDGVTYPVYTFKIRQGTFWSDGPALKAQDFAYAIQRLVDPAVNSPYGAAIGQFFYRGTAVLTGEADPAELGVEVLDDATLRCVMQYDLPYQQAIFACTALAPVRSDIIEQHGDAWASSAETIVTNGMYKVEAWEPGNHLTLAANTSYWNAAYVANGGLTFTFLTPEQAVSSLRAGEILFTDNFPKGELTALNSEGLWRANALLGTHYVAMQTREGLFQDVNVREAFAKAVDPVAAAAIAPGGIASPAYSLVGPGFVDAAGAEFSRNDHMESDSRKRIEQANAARLITGRNYGEITLLCDQADQAIADALAANWKEVIGADVKVQAVSPQALDIAVREGSYQMALVNRIALYESPAALLSDFASYAQKGYQSGAFDQKLHDAFVAADSAGHYRLLQEAEDILLADYAIAPVCFSAKETLYRPEVSGIRISPLGEVFLDGLTAPVQE